MSEDFNAISIIKIRSETVTVKRDLNHVMLMPCQSRIHTFVLHCLGISRVAHSFAFTFDMFQTSLSLHLLTIDPSLGRLDYDSLSDQALMEMLISGMQDKSKEIFQDGNGNFTDACDWNARDWEGPDVRCTNKRVVEIALWNFRFASKQFPFEFIPPLVTSFRFTFSRLCGTLHTPFLPTILEKFNVQNNDLNGSIDFKGLPRRLHFLSLSSNRFCGSLLLADLPDTMAMLDAQLNYFSGEIMLDSLPPTMEEILLGHNELTGPIHIQRLPNSMEIIDVRSNWLSGEFRLLALPPNLREIDISDNSLEERAVISGTTGDMFFKLVHSNIESVIDDKGGEHAWEESILSSRDSESDEDE